MLETAAWIGLSQSLFAGILILTKPKVSLSDKVLGGWLFLMALLFLSTALYVRIFDSALLSGSFLLFNPSIYLYIRSLTTNSFKLRWRQLVHLLPFALFELLAYIKQIPFTPYGFLSQGPHFFYRVLFTVVNLASWALYLPLSISIVLKYRALLKSELSNIAHNESLNWLLFLIIFYLSYSAALLLSGSLEVFTHLSSHITSSINYGALLLLLYIFSFYGLRQKELERLFANLGANGARLAHPGAEEVQSYKNSTLTSEQRENIKNLIISYFNKERPYLNPELNMDSLSAAINVPKYQITEVLNCNLNHNFFQWVNLHRVEAVKEMLSRPTLLYSIEAVGYECGFSSKSSFYSFFKSQTGETPAQYRKRVMEAKSSLG